MSETKAVPDESGGRAADGPPRETPVRPSEGRTVEAEIHIDAPVERVWRAITDADELERWFPLEARVEPGEGGEFWMSWKNEFEGGSRILAWEPPNRLLTTWGELDGNAATGQRTEYRLEGREGGTFLRVVTSGFGNDPKWEAWIEGTRRGWAFELRSLKHYLERHDGEARDVVYLRRRTDLPREEAWARLTGSDGLAPEDFGGTVVDDAPPAQLALLAESPPGLVRLSLEPSTVGADGIDVTLWLSTWGAHGVDIERIRSEWGALLASLYPEGIFV